MSILHMIAKFNINPAVVQLWRQQSRPPCIFGKVRTFDYLRSEFKLVQLKSQLDLT